MNKEKLDIEVIKNLHEFGSLIVYELKCFDPITFQTITAFRTFDEDYAKTMAEDYRKRDFYCSIQSFHVDFNKAFSKKG